MTSSLCYFLVNFNIIGNIADSNDVNRNTFNNLGLMAEYQLDYYFFVPPHKVLSQNGLFFVDMHIVGLISRDHFLHNLQNVGDMGLLPDMLNYGLRMRRECGERFPRHRGLAIPTCIMARASRTCRDACRDR